MFNAISAEMAAEAMLRANGGRDFVVTGPLNVAGANEDGLAITPAALQEWILGPALVRWRTSSDENKREIVVAASTARRIFQAEDAATLRSLLLQCRVCLDNEQLRVIAVMPDVFAGQDYLYRIEVGA